MFNRLSNNKGFTLMELLVVLAIIAALVAFGSMVYFGFTRDAATTGMQNDARILEQAAQVTALQREHAGLVGNALWPIANPVTPLTTAGPNPDIDAGTVRVIESVLADTGMTPVQVTAALAAADDVFLAIYEPAISNMLRRTKFPVNQYFIVGWVAPSNDYNNELEGLVFSRTSRTNRDGVIFSGVHSVVPTTP